VPLQSPRISARLRQVTSAAVAALLMAMLIALLLNAPLAQVWSYCIAFSATAALAAAAWKPMSWAGAALLGAVVSVVGAVSVVAYVVSKI
jgi:hypothetical protein